MTGGVPGCGRSDGWVNEADFSEWVSQLRYVYVLKTNNLTKILNQHHHHNLVTVCACVCAHNVALCLLLRLNEVLAKNSYRFS